MKPLGLRGRIFLGFVVPLAVVLGTWAALYSSLLISVRATRSVSETERKLAGMHSLSRALFDAESAQRGYLLTGNRSFLDAYRKNVEEVGPAASHLETLAEGNPEQQGRVNELVKRFEAWRSEVATPAIEARRLTPPLVSDSSLTAYFGAVDLLRDLHGLVPRAADRDRVSAALLRLQKEVAATEADEADPGDRTQWARALALLREFAIAVDGGKEGSVFLRQAVDILREEAEGNRIADARVRDLIASRKGIRVVDEWAAIEAEFGKAEELASAGRLREAAGAVRRGTALAFVGPFIALALALWGMIQSSVRIARGLEAVGRAAEGVAGGDLGHRVAVDREDEIGRLAKAFNTMAGRLERRAHEQDLLREMGDLLHSCRTLEAALEVLPRFVEPLFPGTGGGVLALSHGGGLFEPAAAWGGLAKGDEFSAEACWAIRKGRVHVSRHGAAAPVCAHAASDAADVTCVPLIAQGETQGVLTLFGGAGAGPRRDAGVEGSAALAEIVGEHIALAVANLRLQETLRDQSVRDPLTGLFNRRYMEETLEREIHRSSRTGTPLSVVMLDVDHFKMYNDTHGHDAGDALLRELANWLSLQLRQGDVACRFGGEEFVLILPGASLEGTRARAERMRQEAAQVRVRYRELDLGRVTLSFGVAAYPAHGETREALLRAVDAALYRAKAEGRDRVAVAD